MSETKLKKAKAPAVKAFQKTVKILRELSDLDRKRVMLALTSLYREDIS